MNPRDFIQKYLPAAQAEERETGVPAIASLTQAAVETAWGERCPGNNFHGIKAGKLWTGKVQLLDTHETLNGKSILFTAKNDPLGKYRKFRAYDTPEAGFIGHGQMLRANRIYGKAFATTTPEAFLDAVAVAGYATGTGYRKLLQSVCNSIRRRMPPA